MASNLQLALGSEREEEVGGYDDPAGLNNRVKAYYAIKSGVYSDAEVKDKKFAELVAMAVGAKTSTGDTLALTFNWRKDCLALRMCRARRVDLQVLAMHTHAYIHAHMHTHVYIYIYIYYI